MKVGSREITRGEVEDFLFHEAAILNEPDYDAWLDLFEPGARYEIPTTDYRGDALEGAGSFVVDDWDLIRARVKRLKSRKAHAENPASRVQRMISNVRLFENGEDDFRVHAAFVVHRVRDGEFNTYVGWYDHLIAVTPDRLSIRRRRCVLGHERLPVGARLSFIL